MKLKDTALWETYNHKGAGAARTHRQTDSRTVAAGAGGRKERGREKGKRKEGRNVGGKA